MTGKFRDFLNEINNRWPTSSDSDKIHIVTALAKASIESYEAGKWSFNRFIGILVEHLSKEVMREMLPISKSIENYSHGA